MLIPKFEYAVENYYNNLGDNSVYTTPGKFLSTTPEAHIELNLDDKSIAMMNQRKRRVDINIETKNKNFLFDIFQKLDNNEYKINRAAINFKNREYAEKVAKENNLKLLDHEEGIYFRSTTKNYPVHGSIENVLNYLKNNSLDELCLLLKAEGDMAVGIKFTGSRTYRLEDRYCHNKANVFNHVKIFDRILQETKK
jgi:hypothetical protein